MVFLKKFNIGIDHEGKPIVIDLKQKRTVIIGERGSGMSFMLRSIEDRMIKAGHIPCMVDIKGEYNEVDG